MTDPGPDPVQRTPATPSEFAAQFAQALRLTYGEAEIVERARARDDLGYTPELQHFDTPHWDQGSGHGDGFHGDLHGDMPHGDLELRSVPTEWPKAADLTARQWEALLVEQRYLLEWARQIGTQFEQRLAAIEETVNKIQRAES